MFIWLDNFEKALIPCVLVMGTVDVLVNCAGTSIAGNNIYNYIY